MDFFTGVPDSLLKDFCAFITDHSSNKNHIIAANEGAAIGIATGYYLATGTVPVVYMQNSGIGNAVNPLVSLADEKVYKIPMLLVIGWRGEPGVKDEPQHVKQGEITLSLLDALNIPYAVLESEENDALVQVNKLIQEIKTKETPHALVVRANTFEKYKLKNRPENLFTLSREEAMKLVVDQLKDSDIVVSTTGKLSRELFEYRERLQQGHSRDFLTVGSMGHSSSLALGIAIQKKDRSVYCLDGDGAFIMHMGASSTIGAVAPANFKHIVFNNGAHESVGGQPTIGFDITMTSIALASGYKNVFKAETAVEIQNALLKMKAERGPTLLEIRVNCHSREDLGRPTTSPIENKLQFMKHVNL